MWPVDPVPEWRFGRQRCRYLPVRRFKPVSGPGRPDRYPQAQASPVLTESSIVASDYVMSTSVNSNRAPPESLSSIESCQSCASAISRTIAKPKPVPESLVE